MIGFGLVVNFGLDFLTAFDFAAISFQVSVDLFLDQSK